VIEQENQRLNPPNAPPAKSLVVRLGKPARLERRGFGNEAFLSGTLATGGEDDGGGADPPPAGVSSRLATGHRISVNGSLMLGLISGREEPYLKSSSLTTTLNFLVDCLRPGERATRLREAAFLFIYRW
jgi:hypothetical protein